MTLCFCHVLPLAVVASPDSTLSSASADFQVFKKLISFIHSDRWHMLTLEWYCDAED